MSQEILVITNKLSIFKKILYKASLPIGLSIFILGAMFHANTVNTDLGEGDQMGYMQISQRMQQTNFEYLGDRNRMPLYPAIQLLVYESGLSLDSFFERGKRLNIAIAVVALILLWFIFRSHLDVLSALNLWFVFAFSVYIFRAGYVQAEVLSYFLVFVCFLMSIRFLRSPSWLAAMALGVLAALAYLTKGTALPGYLLCMSIYVLRQLCIFIRIKNLEFKPFLHKLGMGLVSIIFFL